MALRPLLFVLTILIAPALLGGEICRSSVASAHELTCAAVEAASSCESPNGSTVAEERFAEIQETEPDADDGVAGSSFASGSATYPFEGAPHTDRFSSRVRLAKRSRAPPFFS